MTPTRQPFTTIAKTPQERARATLPDPQATRASFQWDEAREGFGMPDGGVNIAYEALDRHLVQGHGDRLALRWLPRSGPSLDFTYADLVDRAARFAHVLRRHGIDRGDRVFSLLTRVPALYVAALGTWRSGAVFSPLFSAFGPDPVRARMEIGAANALVTTEAFYRKKVMDWRADLPSLHVVLVTGGLSEDLPGVVDLDAALESAADVFPVVATGPEDMATLHFTSGTTGKPKGAVHVHDGVVAHALTGRWALDLHPGDTYWCTADPGWVTGTSYGIISPLVNGVTLIVDEAEFDAERWYGILQDQAVTVWYTAPTAIRMMMKIGVDTLRRFDTASLRFMASVGEPLNPEAVVWSVDAFGRPFHDNWWQTETGAIMIANTAAMDIKPGSMGRPLPGIDAAIVRRTEDGAEEVEAPGEVGELALRPGWPSMFRGYLNAADRTAKTFAGGWYLSGDLAQRDADGTFWFVGRADDVIKSAGHLIGPFEVESILMEHPAVAEAGVIGLPDPVAGEVVKAFVALKHGFSPSDDLHRALLAHARKRLGRAVAPRDIDFRDALPKTRSGKVMRRLLRARELGLPEGDTSTLEGEPT